MMRMRLATMSLMAGPGLLAIQASAGEDAVNRIRVANEVAQEMMTARQFLEIVHARGRSPAFH